MEDVPFIDEAFYGSEIASFKHPLAMIGVSVDFYCAQDLIAGYLRNKTVTDTISRIYMYLKKCDWKPDNNNRIGFGYQMKQRVETGCAQEVVFCMIRTIYLACSCMFWTNIMTES